ncbi:MAG: GTP 3',8-cyclase MoaA [Syntrophomonadaceae bacterium]|jgi:cyclic pyranopterin phosphate synthase
MLDKYGRDINYLRVSVTDRCNLRCRYCMPEKGVDNLGDHHAILSLEDIARLIRICTGVGIRKVRLTGGEPLIRKNISQLIKYIDEMPEIDDIGLTTNGILFGRMAGELKEAGLRRVNFSLDSLEQEKYRYITRNGELIPVMDAIFKALDMNMHPVKINTVVIKGFNDGEIIDFVKLAYIYPLHIRFIEFMPIGDLLFWKRERMISTEEIKAKIDLEYQLVPAKKIEGNGPAKYYNLQGGKGSVGFISPMSNHFCAQCNRIRMTADGRIRGCLHDKKEVDLRPLLQSGAGDMELERLLVKAIQLKPARHSMNSGWGTENIRKMYQIGG